MRKGYLGSAADLADEAGEALRRRCGLAWRGRRRTTWITGVVSFLVSVGAAFTGYLSQQNFDSQWISTQAKDGINSTGAGAIFNVTNFGQMLMWHIVLLPLAAAALLPESFNVFRPIDKACFNRSASIVAEGAVADRDRSDDAAQEEVVTNPHLQPFGHRQQICCEQVELTATMNHLQDVASIVAPLAVPDLPRLILLRSARIVRAGALRKILPLGDKVIVDSARPGAPGPCRR